MYLFFTTRIKMLDLDKRQWETDWEEENKIKYYKLE